jgi:putative membrane-bound dehydrogenase-like protein
MPRFAICALLVASVAAAQPPKPATHQVKLNGHTFTLPEGFTVELAAPPPLADRPIVASFDDRGRLYVADSSGSNEKPADQLKNPTHRLVRLEDADGDGKFDKSTVFADKMMFPEGILWHRGHVYCAAPPHIWKLTDTDDDGKADQREIWFDGKTLTGCANDLHGPYLGPDGWIYWCKGAFAKQEYTLPYGKKFTTRASHVFRARPDGTGIEPVMTGGMDNPVDVAFLPNGERFFTTTFFQHPAAGHRDGLIHAVYGGIYGKDHDVLYDPDHKWTSPNLMPVMTHMGPAAPCGLHCYESDAFGKEYTSNLFACQFNLRKVSRHVLKPSGSTYVTEDSDFLVSDNQDFHPTDVIEDADGSLLVVDTGGWYKLCCPSSQLVKADVLGAIYRVRKSDKKYERKWLPAEIKVEKQNYMELMDTVTLTTQSTIRDRVRDVFRKPVMGRDYVVERLATELIKTLYIPRDTRVSPTETQVRTARLAVWMLCQTGGDRARDYIRQAITEPNPDVFIAPPESVVVAAIHAASVWRDQKAVPLLIPLLRNSSMHIRRAAAEALARIGDDRATEHVLKALADEKNDRALDHALTYALIELDNREYLKNKLDAESPRVRRACLTALDQLGEKLDPKVVLEAMKSPDPALKETAQWIAGRHPEWADQLAGVFREQLTKEAKPAELDALAGQLARFARSAGIQKLLATTATDAKAPAEARTTALRAMARAGLRDVPATWHTAIDDILARKDELHAEAIATLRAFPAGKGKGPDHTRALREVIESNAPFDVRLVAMAALPGGLHDVPKDHLFQRLLDAIDRDNPVAQRGLAADVVSKAKLTSAQLLTLIERLPKVGPLELDRVLGAFAQSKDDAVGSKLIAALNTAELRPALRVDIVKERVKQFGPAVQKEAEKLYAALDADYQQQREKLDETLKTLQPGDVRRGQAVFNSTKAACIACHTIGYVGGKHGPDLTRIGALRNERDLLESILFPSASLVRSYESVTVRTKDGRTFTGVPKKDAPDEMILILAADKEARIPRDDVDEVQPSKVSIMPAGLDKQVTPQELADLIAFLKACK